MATLGPRNGGSFASVQVNLGDRSWSNPSNAQTSNNSRATVSYTTQVDVPTEGLRITSFGFTIPSGARIDGITIGIERSSVTQQIYEYSIRILKDYIPVGDDKADINAFFPTTEAYKNFGSATDTWGTTWTPGQINAYGFGVRIQAIYLFGDLGNDTARIDHVRITIDYTANQGVQEPDTIALGKQLVLILP